MQEITFETYQQFKKEFDQEVGRQAAGFVRMGYLLRVAQDTTILYESGYKSIAEFAWEEYRLQEDTVSRMVSINKRYSQDGYSEHIADRYRGIGTSLLADMLTLSDEVIDALPDGLKREELRVIKKEIKEEEKITDIEVMLEKQEELTGKDNNLTKLLGNHYLNHPEEYANLHNTEKTGLNPKEAAELLAPAGIAVIMARIPGIGKVMLSVKSENQDLELVNVRTNEKELYTWDDCVDSLLELCGYNSGVESDWEFVFRKPYPVQEELEPESEPEKNVVRTPPKKESKPKERKTKPPKAPEPKIEPERESEVTPQKEAEPEIAPAQVIAQTDMIDTETEVIENPRTELKKNAIEAVWKIGEELESENYQDAYAVGKNLLQLLKKIVDIGQDTQLEGQTNIKDYLEKEE